MQDASNQGVKAVQFGSSWNTTGRQIQPHHHAIFHLLKQSFPSPTPPPPPPILIEVGCYVRKCNALWVGGGRFGQKEVTFGELRDAVPGTGVGILKTEKLSLKLCEFARLSAKSSAAIHSY